MPTVPGEVKVPHTVSQEVNESIHSQSSKLTHVVMNTDRMLAENPPSAKAHLTSPDLPGPGQDYYYMCVCMYVCMYVCGTMRSAVMASGGQQNTRQDKTTLAS